MTKMVDKNQTFTYVVWKEGKYFVSQCLNVDVASFGRTHEEALENLDEAVSLYLEDAPAKDIARVEMPAMCLRNHPQFAHA